MIGKTLGRYSMIERIGAGGMGEVYRARDAHLGRDAAIKVLPSQALSDESARKRFRREAETLSKLNHPNIAMVFDFDTEEAADFLIMELVSGTSLSDRLLAGPLRENELSRLGVQIAAALDAAHEQGVIHRDLKPQNIMVTAKGQAKVLDFGLAMHLQPQGPAEVTVTHTETQPTCGTLPYMAPEQLRGEGAVALNRGKAEKALDLLRLPGQFQRVCLEIPYIRGLACLREGKATEAASEFEKSRAPEVSCRLRRSMLSRLWE